MLSDLSVAFLFVVMLSVVMLNAVMLSVVAPYQRDIFSLVQNFRERLELTQLWVHPMKLFTA
jgi:hypothetical protein